MSTRSISHPEYILLISSVVERATNPAARHNVEMQLIKALQQHGGRPTGWGNPSAHDRIKILRASVTREEMQLNRRLEALSSSTRTTLKRYEKLARGDFSEYVKDDSLDRSTRVTQQRKHVEALAIRQNGVGRNKPFAPMNRQLDGRFLRRPATSRSVSTLPVRMNQATLYRQEAIRQPPPSRVVLGEKIWIH